MASEREQPSPAEMDLGAVFAALADPLRRSIVEILLRDKPGAPRQCSTFSFGVSKSTMTHHFKVLREAGLITQMDYGNRCEVALRRDELTGRFPALLPLIEQGLPAASAAR